MTHAPSMQTISAQPKQHVQKALMEYLLLGKIES